MPHSRHATVGVVVVVSHPQLHCLWSNTITRAVAVQQVFGHGHGLPESNEENKYFLMFYCCSDIK